MESPLTTALNVKDIRKTFGSNEVLKGISLTANQGDVISILGSSGSGKSTFLRCINLLETPDSGEVTVSGETILMRKRSNGLSEPADIKQVERIRASLGMVFQSFNLWKRKHCLNASVSPISAISTLHIFPVASNSAPPLRGRFVCAPKSCCSMNLLRRSIRNWWARYCALCGLWQKKAEPCWW